MSKKKKSQKQKDLCLFVVQVPERLKLSFRKACYKQKITAKAAIELFIRAVLSGEIAFNRSSLKIKNKKTK